MPSYTEMSRTLMFRYLACKGNLAITVGEGTAKDTALQACR